MQKATVLQILPRVPPASCGVGDYAWGIARKLREVYGIESHFLSAGISWTEPFEVGEFSVDRLSELKSEELVDFVSSRREKFRAVILHMSSYGYQKRGVPFWLASAWKKLAVLPNRPRLITMFHELSASGPIRSSAFWLQPFQRRVIREVACASDGVRTNRESYADTLRGYVKGRNIEVVTLPVCSNFGEPKDLPKWRDRDAAMAMFGWPLAPRENLDELLSKGLRHCQRFGLKKLHLIGGQNAPGITLPGIELVRHGFMEADAISNLLLTCRLAYTSYNPIFLAKSTLVAAFASHGLVVITQGQIPILPDGLSDGMQVLNEISLSTIENPLVLPLDEIARSLRSWYDGHSIERNAESYARQIMDSPTFA